MDDPPVIRPTVRVLLIDERERVLLFRGEDPLVPETRFWFPTGGGIEPGESPEEAARREVQEETGLIDFELGPHIWNRRIVFTFYGLLQDCRETWFYARVPSFEIDISGLLDEERQIIREHRWWSIPEMQETEDTLAPRNLAVLMRGLIDNGPPDEPLNIPI